MSDSRVVLSVGLAKLLHELGIDDNLRAEFERDPRGVLQRHGVEVPPGDFKVHLPSKEDLQKGFAGFLDSALKNPIMAMAFGHGGHHPHH